MRHIVAAVILAPTLLLSGCENRTATPAPEDPTNPQTAKTATAATAIQPVPVYNRRPFQEGIELSISKEGLDNGVTSTHFNFARLRDLWVRVNLPGMPRVGQLTLVLIDPKGKIGYQASVPYSPDPGMTEMTMPGMMRPVTVFLAKPRTDGLMLDYAIPVSGSVLTRRLVGGEWRVEARISGTGRSYAKMMTVDTTF